METMRTEFEKNTIAFFDYLTEDQKDNIKNSNSTGEILQVLGIYRIA